MSASTTEEKKEFNQESFIDYYPGLMNGADKTLLDLGMGEGPLVLPLVDKGWAITGYDKNMKSVAYLERCGVNAKVQDLNVLDYQHLLVSDLQKTTNVVMINVAPFLEQRALAYLLFNLMDHAQPNTVFMFINAYLPKIKSVDACQRLLALPQNYVTSFFAPRTDMAILKHEVTNYEGIHNDVVFFKKY